jgi:hypothetical protein
MKGFLSDVTANSLVQVYQHFRATYCVHLQVQRLRQTSNINQQEKLWMTQDVSFRSDTLCVVLSSIFIFQSNKFKEQTIHIRLFQIKTKCVMETYNRLNLAFQEKTKNITQTLK